MKQYYSSILFVLLFAAYFPLCAQTTLANPYKFPSEIGILMGASTYAGDIVKNGDYDLGASCFNFGAFYRLYSNNNLSWRFSLNQGKLKGDDLDWEGTDRIGRGFSFSTPLTELAARAEFDFMNHKRWSVANGFQKKFSLYLYAGAGLSLIKPNTFFNPNLGDRYDALIAEDEQNQRSAVFTIPFGGGIKIDLNERWTIGGEVGLNPVFNDYLDGISISANPEYNDWYSVGGITLSYRLQSVLDRRFFIKDKKPVSEGTAATTEK